MANSLETLPVHEFILEFSSQLGVEEKSKIFNRAVEISNKIAPALYEKVVRPTSNEEHGNSNSNVLKKATKKFTEEVLKLDNELMQKHMGEDWEDEMGFHAITADDIVAGIGQPDPSFPKLEMVKYILMRDEFAIREGFIKGMGTD
ncbi:MAG: hypothetical protein K9I74_14795 [Bacteroidales bacterium]|nr:hypothetical protein [Bacteroidales bacterium]